MSSHLFVTVPPSELIRVNPATGIEVVSLKTTTVLPVGIPLAVLSESEVGAAGTGAVGMSEHATTANTSTIAANDDRAANFLSWCIEFLWLWMRVVRSPKWDPHYYVVDAYDAPLPAL
jgi:hypothetical protein